MSKRAGGMTRSPHGEHQRRLLKGLESRWRHISPYGGCLLKKRGTSESRGAWRGDWELRDGFVVTTVSRTAADLLCDHVDGGHIAISSATRSPPAQSAWPDCASGSALTPTRLNPASCREGTKPVNPASRKAGTKPGSASMSEAGSHDHRRGDIGEVAGVRASRSSHEGHAASSRRAWSRQGDQAGGSGTDTSNRTACPCGSVPHRLRRVRFWSNRRGRKSTIGKR